MRLSEIVDSCDKPFEWGTNDCCTLVRNAVLAVQGRDIVEPFLGYTTREGAAQALRDHGQGTLLATLINLLGEPIPVALARPGDIVMLDDFRVGICCGRSSALLEEEGILMVKTLSCVRAFKNRPN